VEFTTEKGRQKWEDDLQRVRKAADHYTEPFTLGQVWHDIRWMSYGRVGMLLLELWRRGYLEKCDGHGVWHVGYLGTPTPKKMRHQALYRWPSDSPPEY
jgi:hypothetical protein